jgi:hypothetical protein
VLDRQIHRDVRPVDGEGEDEPVGAVRENSGTDPPEIGWRCEVNPAKVVLRPEHGHRAGVNREANAKALEHGFLPAPEVEESLGAVGRRVRQALSHPGQFVPGE